MADLPEIPKELMAQILNDPEAVAALQELAGRADIDTPVADMAPDEQLALVTAMMNVAAEAEAKSIKLSDNPAGPAANDDPANIPAALIEEVFADPQADEVLRDIMAGNKLSGDPIDLEPDIKRSIVQLLIDQGVISFGEEPPQKP